MTVAASYAKMLIASAQSSGTIAHLLHDAGLSKRFSSDIQGTVGDSLAIVVTLAVALVANRLGSKAIKRWVGATARRAASRVDSPRATERASGLTALVASIWRGLVAFVALVTILGIININLTPLLAGATVVGATLGFGAQSIIKDVLSGFLLILEDQFAIGDTVTVGTTVGNIEELTLRVTRLRGADGTVWFIPNGDIRLLGNKSRGWARATVEIAVPATAPLEEVLASLKSAANDVSEDPELSPLVMESPLVWGVIDSDATTLTTRLSVRVPVNERDRFERALRRSATDHLQRAGAFGQLPQP